MVDSGRSEGRKKRFKKWNATTGRRGVKIIVARRSALGAPVICVFVIASDSCSPKARENNDGIWCRGAAENARNLRRVWNRFFVFRGQIGVRLLPRTERGERRKTKN